MKKIILLLLTTIYLFGVTCSHKVTHYGRVLMDASGDCSKINAEYNKLNNMIVKDDPALKSYVGAYTPKSAGGSYTGKPSQQATPPQTQQNKKDKKATPPTTTPSQQQSTPPQTQTPSQQQTPQPKINYSGDFKESDIVSLPTSDDNVFEKLPKLASPYKAQINSIDYNSGEVTYKIYDTQKQAYIKGSISITSNYILNISKIAPEKIKKIDDAVANLQKNLADISSNASSTYNTTIKNYKDTLTSEQTSTQGIHFLTLSKLLSAVATLDNTIINLKQSLLLNKIVLQDNYTLDYATAYPATAGFFNTPLDHLLDKVNKDTTMKSLFFILRWQSENDKLIQKIKFFLMTLFMPLVVGYGLFSKLSKKLQKLNDWDDWGEKSVMAIVTLFVFFMPTNVHKVDNKQIELSTYQKWATTIVREGVDFADEMTFNTVTAYSQWQMSNLGIFTKENMKKVFIQKNKKIKQYRDQIKVYSNVCKKDYSINNLHKYVPTTKNDNWTFFSDEMLEQAVKDKKYANTNREIFYAKKNQTPRTTLTFCRNLEQSAVATAKAITANDKFIKKLSKVDEDTTDDIKLVTNLTKQNYIFAKRVGFISSPFLLASNFFLQLDASSDVLKVIDDENNKKMQEALEKYSEDSDDGMIIKRAKRYILGKMASVTNLLAYNLVPGFPNMKKSINDGMDKLIDTFPISSIDSVMKVISYMLSWGFSIYIIKHLLMLSPALAVLIGGAFKIGMYIISLFVYFFVSVFLIVYAFSSEHTPALGKFISRGVVLSLQPIFIVMSIVLAIYGIDAINFVFSFFGNIIMKVVLNNSSGLNILFISFFKQLFYIFELITQTIFAGIIMFKGDDIFLSLFGFRESGINVSETIGNEIKDKAQKYYTSN